MDPNKGKITAPRPLTLTASNSLTIDLSAEYTNSHVDNLISCAQTNLGTTSNLSISSLTTQGANAIRVYSGANKTLSITQDGSITCTQISTNGATGLFAGDGRLASANITYTGNIACTSLGAGTLVANGSGGIDIYNNIAKTASILHAWLLTAKAISMANINCTLTFDGTPCLCYNYNSQLTGDITGGPAGVALDHTGKS